MQDKCRYLGLEVGMFLYHFTDTARLPWISRSGELQPGRNRAGGFPDPDFLWATTDARGDGTASADRGEGYRTGKIWHVRFTVDATDFFPWGEVPHRFPQWTIDQVRRLEAGAAGKSTPAAWWCREQPLRLSSCVAVDVRSYANNRWRPVPIGGDVVDMVGEDGGRWLAVETGGMVFASRQQEYPHGLVGYEIRTTRA